MQALSWVSNATCCYSRTVPQFALLHMLPSQPCPAAAVRCHQLRQHLVEVELAFWLSLLFLLGNNIRNCA